VKQWLAESLREAHLPPFPEDFENVARRAFQERLSHGQNREKLSAQECQVERMNRMERRVQESDLPLGNKLAPSRYETITREGGVKGSDTVGWSVRGHAGMRAGL
jgi:hypothetical protein